MTKQVLKMSSMLGLVAALAVTAVRANPAVPLRAKIPFAITVGSKTLPAGVYKVMPTTTTNVLHIRREDTYEGALILTNGVHTQRGERESKLVFRRYGDQYFLAQVWTAETSTMSEVQKTREERELIKKRAKFLARNVAEPEEVSILAQ